MKSLNKMLPAPKPEWWEQEIMDRDEIQKTVIQCVSKSHQAIAVCYEGIPVAQATWRKTVRDYVNQKPILSIESAIDGQIAIAMDRSQPEPIRKDAQGKVVEGMAYWQNLIMKRIEMAA